MQTAETPSKIERTSWSKAATILGRIAFVLIAVTIFIYSLLLLKAGAGPLTPWIRNGLSVDSVPSALGFGWLAANVALSGSPVAAIALTFLDAGVLSVPETFAMIAGSRLGAAMLVLLIGFVYVLRGKQRDLSLNVGLLSLLVTQTIYPPVLLLGYYLLSSDSSQSLQIKAAHGVQSPLQMFFDPLIHGIQEYLPAGAVLLLGFLLLLVSLWLFDKAIPSIHLGEEKAGIMQHLLLRPVVMFLIGAVVTMVTMSVSVSLGLLVPLSVRGYVRRENVIPYILGANITTFVDTLIAAALLMNPAGLAVVLVQMVSVAVVSLVILITSYRFYQHFVERMAELINKRRLHLVLYVSLIILIPFILVIFG
jgi:sodium-dependent phosphate cotransporter